MARINNLNRINTLAAVLGGSAVVAMGVAAATLGGEPDGAPTVVSDSQMTIGETTTVTNSGTIAPVVAAPAVKAPPYGQS